MDRRKNATEPRHPFQQDMSGGGRGEDVIKKEQKNMRHGKQYGRQGIRPTPDDELWPCAGPTVATAKLIRS